MLRFLCAMLVLACAPVVEAQAPPSSIPITVTVHGLRSDRGHVRIALYADPAKWTLDAGVVARCVGTPRGGDATCVLSAPRAGRYAFALLADEDDDRRMRKDLLGIPQEGYGFSNDVRPALSVPSFASASFEVTGPTRVRVTARYGI